MSNDVDLRDFIAGFIAESDELVAAANASLLDIEAANLAGTSRPRAVRDLFRALHTLKGLAAMIGVEPIIEVAHNLETLVRTADRAGGALSREAVDVSLRGVAAIAERVRAVAEQRVPAAIPTELLDAIEVAAGAAAGSPRHVPATARAARGVNAPGWDAGLTPGDRLELATSWRTGRRAWRVSFVPSEANAGRGITIASVRARFAELGDVIKVLPRATPGQASSIAFDLVVASDASIEALAQAAATTADRVVELVAPLGPLGRPEEASDAGPGSSAGPADAPPQRRWWRRAGPRAGSCRAGTARRAAGPALAPAGVAVSPRARDRSARRARRRRACAARDREPPGPPAARPAARDPARPDGAGGRGPRAARPAGAQPGTQRAEGSPARAGRARRRARQGGGRSVVAGTGPPGAQRGGPCDRARRRAGGPGQAAGRHRHGALPRRRRQPARADRRGRRPRDRSHGDRGARGARGRRRRGAARCAHLARVLDPRRGDADQRARARDGHRAPDRDRRPGRRARVIEHARQGDRVHAARPADDRRGRRVLVRVRPRDLRRAGVFGRGDLRGPQGPGHPAAGSAGRAVPVRLAERRGQAIPLRSLGTLLAVDDGAEARKAIVVRRQGAAVGFTVNRMLGRHEVVVRPVDDVLVRVPGIAGSTDLGDGRPTLVLNLYALTARGEERPV